MFNQVTTKLLEGGFVCEASMPEAYRWLVKSSSQQEVSDFVSKLGRRLTKTANEQAFYLVWEHIGAAERADVKKTFAHIKQTIAPVMDFMIFCMDAEKREVCFSAGDQIEFAALLRLVSENPHAMEKLRELGALSRDFLSSDPSAKGMLEKAIGQMVSWEYLILTNKEHLVYRFTGKVDYYEQVIHFLGENQPGAGDGSTEGGTLESGGERSLF